MNGFCKKNAYTKTCGNTDILIMRNYDGYGMSWDVYYKRPHYAFTFAFGVSVDQVNLADAMRMAEENANKLACNCLFEEEYHA